MSRAVQSQLEEQLLTPTIVSFICHLFYHKRMTKLQSPFSKKFRMYNMHSVYKMFGIDLLHKVEVRTWKATLTHLSRLLVAKGGDSITMLNDRFVAYTVNHFPILNMC